MPVLPKCFLKLRHYPTIVYLTFKKLCSTFSAEIQGGKGMHREEEDSPFADTSICFIVASNVYNVATLYSLIVRPRHKANPSFFAVIQPCRVFMLFSSTVTVELPKVGGIRRRKESTGWRKGLTGRRKPLTGWRKELTGRRTSLTGCRPDPTGSWKSSTVRRLQPTVSRKPLTRERRGSTA